MVRHRSGQTGQKQEENASSGPGAGSAELLLLQGWTGPP